MNLRRKIFNLKEVGHYTVKVDVGHFEVKECSTDADHPYPHTWTEKRWVKTGEKSVTVALSIDVDAIAQRVVGSAARGKTGKAKFLSGAIVAKRMEGK